VGTIYAATVVATVLVTILMGAPVGALQAGHARR
jgi:hypothetical protein